MANKNLHDAKKNKNDEFYTQLSDIEKELKYYKEHFEDKVIFCNCNDPKESNFWQYFSLNFNHFKIKKLLATHYDREQKGYMLEMYRDESGVHINIKGLEENGDFRSPECIELLKQSDIVVTNPPFSLFREYVAQLIKYDKEFVIIGHQNAIKYKEIFPLIKENRIWLGYGFNGGATHFINKYYEDYATASNHKDGMIRVSGVVWYTNLDISKRHEKLILYKQYNEEEYPKYDNYDAINVDKVKDIPLDYNGIMGVPITYIDKHNPEQFEIIGELNHGCDNEYDFAKPIINGVEKYPRILIRRIKNANRIKEN